MENPNIVSIEDIGSYDNYGRRRYKIKGERTGITKVYIKSDENPNIQTEFTVYSLPASKSIFAHSKVILDNGEDRINYGKIYK